MARQYSCPAWLDRESQAGQEYWRIEGFTGIHGDLGVGVGDLEADAARAAVREQSEIPPRRKTEGSLLLRHLNGAPLYEMVPTAACAQLLTGHIAKTTGKACVGPCLV